MGVSHQGVFASNVSVKPPTRHWRCRRPSTVICSVLGILLLAGFMAQVAFCAEPSVEPAPDGKALFAQHCAVCHGEMGQGRSANTSFAGPNLQAEHDEGVVLSAVEVGPSHMPSFAYILSVPEMRAVAKYVTQQIAVVPLVGGNLSEGGELFRAYCGACHGTSAHGGGLAFANMNAPALTNFSAEIIAGTIRWGPGSMPSFPPTIISNQQLASIVDYVKFSQRPPAPGGITLHFLGPSAEGLIGFLALFLLIGFSMWIEKGGKG